MCAHRARGSSVSSSPYSCVCIVGVCVVCVSCVCGVCVCVCVCVCGYALRKDGWQQPFVFRCLLCLTRPVHRGVPSLFMYLSISLSIYLSVYLIYLSVYLIYLSIYLRVCVCVCVSVCRKFEDYGQTFGTGDVLGCLVDREEGKLLFTKNGEALGVAFHLPNEMQGRGLFPAVCGKNFSVRRLPLGEETVWVGKRLWGE